MKKLDSTATLMACFFASVMALSMRLNEILLEFQETPQQKSIQQHSPPPFKVKKKIISHRKLLNDQTLDWDGTVYRPWLEDTSETPPAMLLFTQFGWNQPNQTQGLDVYRNVRTRELANGIINHPWFHPTAWRDYDIIAGTNKETRYYVFLDKHSCGEKNYPRYDGKGQEGIMLNRDEQHGRGACCLDSKNHYVDEIMASSLFTTTQNAVLVLFDCSPVGPILKNEFKRDRRKCPSNQLVFASISAPLAHMRANHDVGLVPPARHACDDARLLDGDCSEDGRPILLSFAGQVGQTQARLDLERLGNEKDVLVGGWEKPAKWLGIEQQNDRSQAYTKLAAKSKFAAVPRAPIGSVLCATVPFASNKTPHLGDNLYSYHLTEVMSCGSIPVIYSDDWKLPFGDALVHWNTLAIMIPEADVNQSESILRRVTPQQACAMRRRVREFYETYMKDGTAVIRGIIETLELQQRPQEAPTRDISAILDNFILRNSSHFPLELLDSKVPGVPPPSDW